MAKDSMLAAIDSNRSNFILVSQLFGNLEF